MKRIVSNERNGAYTHLNFQAQRGKYDILELYSMIVTKEKKYSPHKAKHI